MLQKIDNMQCPRGRARRSLGRELSQSAGRHTTCVVAVVACLASWARSAAAGPGVIVAPRVEAFAAPSSEASVAAELGQGAQICVLDETNASDLLLHRV